MLQIEQKIKCEICNKKMKVFSGFENWSIMDKCRVLSLCKKCSRRVEKYIKELKNK